ncbi:MAG: serine protease Do [Acidobacteriota bacterium]|nr:serine protease Do [Acidobacteriota bacterium]
MRPETEYANHSESMNTHATDNCPSCLAGLLPGMRFCRACGFRLGEGIAEYTETVRLDGMPLMSAAKPGAQTFGINAPATTMLSARATRTSLRGRRVSHCGGASSLSWFKWVLIAFIIASASGGGAAIMKNVRRSVALTHITIPLASRSFIGVDDFDYVRGEGLLLDAVLPGTPAERAGLRDGDLIQRFDGKTINSEEDMRDTLRRTTIGKTVEVVYARDGEVRTTRLTTVASADYDQQAFMPPDGTGYWGIDNLDRVPVEGTNLYGVQLGGVVTNRPADIAGLKRGDIVTEFDGNPVRTVDGLASYIHHAAPGSIVRVAVIRDGGRVELPVKMGKND